MDTDHPTITADEIRTIYAQLRAGADSGTLRPIAARKQALRRLKRAIRQYSSELVTAMQQDFGKPSLESQLSEISFCLTTIDYTLNNLDRWAAPKKVNAGLLQFPAKAISYYQPKGVVLILCPWNYPTNLTLAPLIAAVSAGCTAVVKPAEATPHTSDVLKQLIETAFPPNQVQVVQGAGSKVVPVMMDAVRFDHVFYTGSTNVGRIIAGQCAEKLISCTLELGGKSPAIVWRDADLEVTAQRIIWGKFFNAGQTCVAPDYVLVHELVYDDLLELMKKTIRQFYGTNPQAGDSIARIISNEHFDRLAAMLQRNEVAFGGTTDRADRYIEPTLVVDVDLDSELMNREIFGPLLPIIPVEDWEEVRSVIARNPNPLAAYLFTDSDELAKTFVEEVKFGGGCINDVILHLNVHDLPFGGVNQSGIGRYHSDEGFKTFSDQKSILHNTTWPNPSVRYPPYSALARRLMRLIS